MARPVVIVTSGAPGFVNSTNGAPATPVASGGSPIVLVDAGGPAIYLVNDDGSAWAGSYSPSLDFSNANNSQYIPLLLEDI